MSLDDDQKKAVSGWIADGRSVSEIQDMLRSELNVAMTYMEVRFLVDDLGLQFQDPEPEPEPEPGEPEALEAPAPNDAIPAGPGEPEAEAAVNPEPAHPEPQEGASDEPEGASGGNVTVSVDKIARPGAIVSGKATFSDGNTAEWLLDQMGRLGVVPEVEGYKPSAADVAQFQASLQEELQKLGF